MIGNTLEKLIKANKIDKKDFAEIIGIHKNTLTKYIKGGSSIPIDLLIIISKTLKSPIEIFFNEDRQFSKLKYVSQIQIDDHVIYIPLKNPTKSKLSTNIIKIIEMK